MRKLLIISSFSLLLTACVTPYQRSGLTGGYSEIQLNDDLYKVSFEGNGYASQQYVAESLLRRCAELTIKNGYKYFLILASSTDSKNYSYTTPTTVNTASNAYLTGGGYGNANLVGNQVNYNSSYSGNYSGYSTTTINQGQTFNSSKYGVNAIIKMTNKKHENALNAEIILRNFVKNK